jgi:cellulose synthase (UDP-forming)
MAQAATSPDSGHRFVTTATEPPEHVLARYRALWTILFATLLPVAALDVGLEGQVWLAGLVVLAILTANLFEFGGFARLMVMLLAAFISVRYHAWRIFYTLPPVGAPGFIPGLLVYLAEVLTFVSFLLGLFVNIRPVQSRMSAIRLPALPPDQVPTVDVYVPTYNEEPELLRTTLLAATQIDYPAGRHTVYLLDDGGSEQKRGDKDPAKAAAALARHEELKALCAELGCVYMTRARNEHAKAGNLNAALPRTTGDLILILDADHIPTQDILQNTVPHFLGNERLFLVQTPHFFSNPDPIEHNLGVFRQMPGEIEMFYAAIQRGLDFWNGAFFCGSAALIRRKALESVGGLASSTITEDAETACELHARGWHSLYVDRPMVAGLSPESMSAFLLQRCRWAQGMIQLLILKNPLMYGRLGFAQRLAYLSSALYWTFPVTRFIFLLAPMFYIWFSLEIFEANLNEFLAFALPHLVTTALLANYTFGRLRMPFQSDVYEMLQAPFLMPAIASVVRSPRKPTFKVTPKGGAAEGDYVSEHIWPVAGLMGVILATQLFGMYRFVTYPAEQQHLTIVMIWNLLNLLAALTALAAMFERGRPPEADVLPLNKEAKLVTSDGEAKVTIAESGPRFAHVRVSREDAKRLTCKGAVELQFVPPGKNAPSSIRASVIRERRMGRAVDLQVRLLPQSLAEEADLVRLNYGSSERWQEFMTRRRGRRPAVVAILYLFSRGVWRLLGGGRTRRSVPALAVQEP